MAKKINNNPLVTNVVNDTVKKTSKYKIPKTNKTAILDSNPLDGSVVDQLTQAKDSQDNSKSSNKNNSSNDPNSYASIAFGGQMSAEIIRDVIKLFILNEQFTSATEPMDADGTNGDEDDSNDPDQLKNDASYHSEQGTGYDAEGHSQGAISSLLYKYQLNGAGIFAHIKDILHVAIPDDADSYIQSGLNTYDNVSDNYADGKFGKVFNPDESMIPSPPQFLGYNGSILAMINDLSNRPFNELYFTHEESTATLHYRQTPFEEGDWFKLPKVSVTTDEILSLDLTLTDQEQYSIFKLTSQNSQSSTDPAQFVLPITDDKEELIGRYGYKTMEKETQYFDNPTSDDSDGVNSSGLSDEEKSAISNEDTTDDVQASKFYPPYTSVLAYADTEGMNSASKKEFANKFVIDSAYGGNGLYDAIKLQADTTNVTNAQKTVNIQNAAIKYSNNHGIRNPISNSMAIELAQLSRTGQLNKYTYITTIYPDSALPFNQGSMSGQEELSGALKTAQGRKEHPNKAAADIVIMSNNRIGSAQARALIDSWNRYGTLTATEYNRIMNTIHHSSVDPKVTAQIGNGKSDKDKGVISSIYQKYQNKLFNWYADNAKFYSGEIQIVGKVGIEFGKRLYFQDGRNDNSLWEFYIESVSHEFDYQSGWTTTVGVTRGIRVSYIGDPRRFRMFWGHGASFTGGFFGEPKIRQALADAIAASSGGDDSSSGGDSTNFKKGSFTWPVDNKTNPTGAQLFGNTRSGTNSFHDGIDFNGAGSRHVYAAKSGKVIFAGNPGAGYSALGVAVIVIKAGKTEMIYQEFGSKMYVKKGDKVKAGQKLADIGNNGAGTDLHLHFGMTNKDWRSAESSSFKDDGTWINPSSYFGI